MALIATTRASRLSVLALAGLGLELGGEGSSCLGHRWTPGFELTLLTRRPPSVGKSSQSLGGVGRRDGAGPPAGVETMPRLWNHQERLARLRTPGPRGD